MNFSYQLQSPNRERTFVVQASSDHKINKSDVIGVIQNFPEIRAEEYCIDVKDKLVHIKIEPLSEKHYLDSVETIVKIQKNWFENLCSEFVKFFTWLLGIETSQPLNKMEVAFAMHLFRNADTEVFQKLTQGRQDILSELNQLKLAFSDVLGIWNNYFEKLMPHLSQEEKDVLQDFLPALKDLQRYQRKVEEIRLIENKKNREKARNKLLEEMIEKAQNVLDDDKPFYMPGGYINPQTGTVVPMVYELSKTNEGELKFRVVDLSETISQPVDQPAKQDSSTMEWQDVISMVGGEESNKEERITPSMTSVFPANSFDDDLNTIIINGIRAQIGPPHALFKKKLNVFDAIKMMLSGPDVDEEGTMDEDFRKELVEDLPSQNTIDDDTGTTTKRQAVVEPAKLMEIFVKSTKPDLYKGKKNLLKVSAFLSLYRQMEKKLNDPELRHWLRSNAQHLLETLKKTEEPQQDSEYIKEQLHTIIDHLNLLDQTQKASIPVSPKRQKAQKSSFGEGLHVPLLANTNSYKTAHIRVRAADPLSDISFDTRSTILSHLTTGMETINKLIEKSDWDNAELLLEDMSNLFEKAREALDHLTEEEANEWSSLIRDFGLQAARINYGQGRIVPEPQYIQYLLQSLALTDQIYRRFDEDVFEDYCFDMAPVEQVLKDPYLSLGSRSSEIEKHLQYLKQTDKTPIRLTNPNGTTGKECYYNDVRFYNSLSFQQGMRQDIGQKGALPPQLVNMRQLYVMIQAFLAPSRTFIAQGIGNLLGAGLNILEEVQLGGVLAGEESITSKFYSNSIKQTIKTLKTTRGPITFEVCESMFGYGKQFVIQPWGLAIQDFDDEIRLGDGTTRFDFEHPQFYLENGIPIEDEKAQKMLFEQCVGQEQEDRVDEEGRATNGFNFFGPKYQRFGVNGRTQLAILRDKLTMMGLPSDVIQELQLMHTGTATRIKETVGKLSKHAGLLNSGKFSSIFQRLFERNFFRDNRIIQQLREDPSYAPTLVSQLKEISISQKDSHQYRSYLFIIDLCFQIYTCLEDSEAKQQLRNIIIEAKQDIEVLKEKADQGESPYATYQRDFHFHSLLIMARAYDSSFKESQEAPNLNDETISRCLHSHFVLNYTPMPSDVDPQKVQAVKYLMHRIRPLFKEVLEDETARNAHCNAILQQLVPGMQGNDLVWKSKDKSGFLFTSGKYTLDVKEGVLWENNQRKCVLPGSVVQHPDFEEIRQVLKESGYQQDLKEVMATLKTVKRKGEYGSRFDFVLEKENRETQFRVILTDSGELRLYKKLPIDCCSSKWFQYQPEIVSSRKDLETATEEAKALLLGKKTPQQFPRELKNLECWISDDGALFRAEKQGKAVYKGHLRGKSPKISSLQDCSTDMEVLNPWSRSKFNVFKRIEDPAHIVAKGKNGKVHSLEYSRFNLEYRWDKEAKRWISPQHKYHYLSARNLNDYFYKDAEQDEEVAPHDMSALRNIFLGTFTHYQLLESDSFAPKVVLTCTEYRKLEPEKDKFNLHLQKHSKRQHPQYEVEKEQTRQAFVYTADPNKGLVCEDVPDGYLYLSYVLLTQGKYKESIRYLKKADINRPMSETANQIVGWIQSGMDKSPEAKAYKMHLMLMLMRQASLLKPRAKQTTSAQQLTALAAIQYRDYRSLVKESRITHELQLSDIDRMNFKRYCEKSLYYVGYKLLKHKELFSPLSGEFEQISQDIQYIRDPHQNALIKAAKLLALQQKIAHPQNEKTFEEIKAVLFDKLHVSVVELYEWYESGLLQEIMQGGKDPQDLIEDIIAYENAHQIRLKSSLRQEIRDLENRIPEQKISRLGVLPEDPIEEPIRLLYCPLYPCFDYEEVDPTTLEDWKEKHESFLSEVAQDGKEVDVGYQYAQEIATELANDFAIDLASQGVNVEAEEEAVRQEAIQKAICKKDKIKTLINRIDYRQNSFNKLARTHKLDALQKLPRPASNQGQWEKLLDKVKERNTTWQETIFDTALRCFGEEDWSLIEELFEDKEAFRAMEEALEEACRGYLMASIRSQQCVRVKNSLYKLKELFKESDEYAKKSQDKKSQEVYDLIHTSWEYHPIKDPDSRSFLLLEYELGFTCRKSQVGVVRASLHKDNQFKQEICGGGKTTVLRNIITHWRADGATLSGVSTLEPLRKTHGVLFSRTTLHAFGEKSLDFVFDRKTPSDEASLLKLHRNLLLMIVERGRIDLTKGDLLSFKLEQKLKEEQIRKLRTDDPNSPRINELHSELDIMENIRDLLKARASINADELDKDCDPTQEKNYAYGEPCSLNETKVGAALELFEMIFTLDDCATYAEALRKNQQSNLSKDEIEGTRIALAIALFDQYKGNLGLQDTDQATFVAYMTEIDVTGKNKDAFFARLKDFYEEHIKPKPKGEQDEKYLVQAKICFMHEFLTQIMPHASTKTGGVNFGRSEDLIHVIPFEGSDNPREGSEHGLESEQIWYTLMDYVDTTRDGVSPSQIHQLVINKKKTAANEVTQSRKLKPEAPTQFNNTKDAQEFQNSFGILLSKVEEDDYSSLAEGINSQTNLLFNFIKTWIFSEYQKSSEKIVSDSQDPPSMVESYSGSSGTDNAKYAMPDSIDIEDVRQPGVHGKVIRSLLEIDENLRNQGSSSFLPYVDDIVQTLANKIKGGDCLSDVGVAFPGVSAVEIAKSLSRHKPNLTFRFMNRNDEWKMLKKGKVIDVDPNIPLTKIFTIFDDTHTRGAERPSTEGVTEYVTVDENTTWSKFEQGVLRERGVTKGKATVKYLIAPSLEQKWANDPTMNKLFKKLIENEAEYLKTINNKAEKQKIKAIPRHKIEETVRQISKQSRAEGSPAHHLARELIHEKTRDYFIKSTETDPASAGEPSGMVAGGFILTEMATTQYKDLDKLISEDGDLIRNAKDLRDPSYSFVVQFCQSLNNTLEQLKAKKSSVQAEGCDHKPRIADKFIPSEVPNRESDLDNEQSMEQEQEMEAEQEQEQEQETKVEDKIDREELPHVPLGLANVEPKNLAAMLCGEGALLGNRVFPFSAYVPYQHPNKYFTENFSPVIRAQSRNVKPWKTLKTGEALPQDQNRISRTLFVIDTNTNAVGELVPSLKDNDTDIEAYVRNHAGEALNDGIILSIYNYDTDCVDGGIRWDRLTPEQAHLINEQIVSTKFQNGQVSYMEIELSEDPSPREILLNQFSALVNWLANCGEDLHEMERTFNKFVRDHRISHQDSGNDIARAFRQARALR